MSTCSWVEVLVGFVGVTRPAMDAQIENVRVIVGELLDTVAMVDVCFSLRVEVEKGERSEKAVVLELCETKSSRCSSISYPNPK